MNTDMSAFMGLSPNKDLTEKRPYSGGVSVHGIGLLFFLGGGGEGGMNTDMSLFMGTQPE